MDETRSPWRALEADAPASGAGAAEGKPGAPSIAVIGGFGLAAILAIGAFVLAASGGAPALVVEGATAAGSGVPVAASSDQAPAGMDGSVVVEIVGAVVRPGVYRMPAGSRIGDVVREAGGYGPRVDAARASEQLNLAALVADGDLVRVPSRDDPPAPVATAGGGGGGSASGRGGLVNVNTASAGELEELPGIGPATAQKIIAAREEQPFASVDDLRARKVVGAATFEKIRELVTAR